MPGRMMHLSTVGVCCLSLLAAGHRVVLDVDEGHKQEHASFLGLWAGILSDGHGLYEGASSGRPSIEIYGTYKDPDDPKKGVTFTEERERFHSSLIDEAMRDMRALAELMKASTPGIYCLRGNTAAGKSTTMRSGLIPELEALTSDAMKSRDFAMINPDIFKLPLIEQGRKDGRHFTHYEVHLESCYLTAQCLEKILQEKVINDNGEKVPASFVVDRRLNLRSQIFDELIPAAESTSRKVFIYDIDCPLKLSLEGILLRPRGGKDPIPPFGVVAAGGYGPLLDNRQELIDLFKQNRPVMGDYMLFETRPDMSKAVVLTVHEGVVDVKDPVGYELLMATDTKEVIKAVESTVIDDAEVRGICGHLKTPDSCVRGLCGWKQSTWKAAVDGWALGTMTPDKSKCPP